MTPFYTILTNYGKTVLAEALAAQKKLEIPYMAVGDGGGAYYEPIEEQTNLRNERWRGDLNDLRTDEDIQGQVIAEAIIPMGIEGDWTVREIGLFDAKGGLIAVGKYPETYIPSALSGAKSQVYINIIIKVDNVAAVELLVNHDTVIASKQLVLEKGYGVVGSFEDGLYHLAAINSPHQLVYFKKENALYYWEGELPKAVTPNSVPGSEHNGKWIRFSDGSQYIYPGGDAAIKLRDVLNLGLSPFFMNGIHTFETTIKDGDGNECFALIPSNTKIYTESKEVVLRPAVAANSFLSTTDITATDIYVQSCTAFGVAEGTTSPRLVSCFFPARAGDEGRIVRFNISEVNLVDFDKGYDAYTWSSYLTNTDIGWCETGYNFREGARAPTSLRLMGTGATSCSTAYNIERTTYSIMINAFADDADVGIKIGEAKGLSIIQPGFEYCKQFAIIGTDHWESTSTGINWQGAFCWQRVRKGKGFS
ncbi:phage tail-collar fiber domain-containing protein [Providencia sp. PROV077]|uniref:phage tail-collar fiber domain-containing protein n=1 Tax=Providencia sp. PROV077 TaxID=2949799 RepID=UPI00234A195C|nr:phage tail protein [Providencia sp. PROV077]